MRQEGAIEAFAALAQESRMSIFRLLVRETPRGVAVGEISGQLNIVPSTLSGHLAVLRRAGLLTATRQQREIHYSANLDAIGDLVRFMLEDCCNGQVENCRVAVSLLSQDTSPLASR